jgi:hypothetical protein
MRNLVLGIAVVLGIATCCKEKAPDGLVLVDASISSDTSYTVSPIPTAQLKNVFVEEFTGVACPNCPLGAAIIKTVQNANPNRVLVAKVHSDFLATPIKTTDNDLRCEDAQSLELAISNAPKPAASIDRLYNTTNSNYVYSYGFWNGLLSAQLAKASPLNLNLAIDNYDNVSKLVKLKTQATFTSSFTDSINYHIYVLENHVLATQDSTGVKIADYVHEEVLRDIITPVGAGSPWLNAISPKPAGLEALKFTSFTLPANVIDPAKCVILVAVQNARTKEMIQVSEVKLQ